MAPCASPVFCASAARWSCCSNGAGACELAVEQTNAPKPASANAIECTTRTPLPLPFQPHITSFAIVRHHNQCRVVHAIELCLHISAVCRGRLHWCGE